MGVLDGIKILELARVPPAEMPGMLLADMGADVLKIETPEPERPQGEEWVRRTIFAFTNRNKRSMTLNMKSAEGQAIFRKLAATADVLVEGFRPGVMKRLGADYETLAKLGWKPHDADLYEVNEAFGSVPLAWAKAIGADINKLNVNGGAQALGHPLGATGAKLLGTLAYELRRRKGKYGLLTICEGLGTANATIIESCL